MSTNSGPISHGLLSRDVLLPGEDATLLNRLRDQITSELKPVGEMETLLVERIVSSTWRLKRLFRIERHSASTAPLEEVEDTACVIVGGDYRYPSWQNYIRYETAIERQIYRAMHELARLQEIRHRVEMGFAETKDLEPFDPSAG